MNKAIITSIMCALLVTACSPKSEVIPTDPKEWDSLAPHIKKLNDEDRRLVGAYMLRHGIAGAFTVGAAGIPPGTTIADAIEEQRNVEAQQKKDEAEAAALRAKTEAIRAQVQKQISEAATVAVGDLKLLHENIYAGRYSDRLNFTISVENKGGRQIDGIKGTVIISDLFDKPVSELNLDLIETIAPGKIRSFSGYGRDLNQFSDDDKKLATTDLSKLKVRFVPDTVVFSDGTKIESPEAPML